MMRLRSAVGMTACGALLTGCASMPHVGANYYYPRALTEVSVVQTLGCTPDGRALVSAISVIPTTIYKANHDTPAGVLDYSNIGGLLTDSDVSLSFTAGHTLSAINATNTGEGAAVVKSVVSLATAAAAAGPFYSTRPVNVPKPDEITRTCDLISQIAGKSQTGDQAQEANATPRAPQTGAAAGHAKAHAKHRVVADNANSADGNAAPASTYKPGTTISLTYTANLVFSNDMSGTVSARPDPDAVNNLTATQQAAAQAASAAWKPGDGVSLAPDPASAAILESLPVKNYMAMSVVVSGSKLLDPNVSWPADTKTRASDKSFKALSLNRVTEATLKVSGPDKFMSGTPVPIWEGKVYVPDTDKGALLTYEVPVPKGVAFGKQGFTLSLNDDGSISKLEFTTNTGASDAVDAATAAAKALPQAQTQAEKDQTQADAIYAHQRLIQCQTTGACPSK